MTDITTFLALRDGAAAADLASAIRRIEERTQFTGKPSGLTLTLTVSRSRQTRGALMLKCEIAVTLAKLERDGSAFFADDPRKESIPGN